MSKILEFTLKQRWILTELKYLVKLGIVGGLGYSSDALQLKLGTIFISRTSGADIGNKVSALLVGQTVMILTSYVIMQGIVKGMNTLCSQAYGATNYKLMGTYFMRAMTIASLTCFPIWAIWISVRPVIYYITQDSELAQGAGDYTTVLCFSYPVYIYSKLAYAFLQSQNIVYPSLAIQVSGNLFNCCLQYIFVVLMHLEIKGVALAYVISTFLIAILIFAYIQFTNVHLTYSLFSWSYLSRWYHFMEYGLLEGLQVFTIIIAARLVPVIFIGFIFKNNNQLGLFGILNVVWFLFKTSGNGFGIGANIRIGNILGDNNLVQAKKATVVFICAMSLIELTFGIMIISFSHYISFIFTSLPDFRKEIEFGLKIVGVLVITDVFFVIRGICNACCLQMKVFIGQSFFTIVAATLGCVLVYYVTWQAVGFYLLIAIGQVLSCCYFSVLLCTSSWDKIAQKVSKNTSNKNLHNNLSETTYQKEEFSEWRKIVLFIRYIIFFLVGIATFVIVMIVTIS